VERPAWKIRPRSGAPSGGCRTGPVRGVRLKAAFHLPASGENRGGRRGPVARSCIMARLETANTPRLRPRRSTLQAMSTSNSRRRCLCRSHVAPLGAAMRSSVDLGDLAAHAGAGRAQLAHWLAVVWPSGRARVRCRSRPPPSSDGMGDELGQPERTHADADDTDAPSTVLTLTPRAAAITRARLAEPSRGRAAAKGRSLCLFCGCYRGPE
jgi:hypothetical protein